MLNLQSRAPGPQPGRWSIAPGAGRGRTAMLVGAAAVAGVLAIVVARWWTATDYQPAPAGLPDAGPLTAMGLPVTQFVQRMAGIAVVGLLLRSIAPAALSQRSAGHLEAMTVRWAAVWAAGTASLIMFTASYLIGVPVSTLPGDLDAVLVVLGNEQLLAQEVTLWLAVVIALFGNRRAGAVGTVALLALAAAALLPGALTGHAAHHGNPVTAMTVLGVHVVTAAVWVGGLLALVLHLRRFPSDLRLILPRFSTVALVCLVAVGISGLLESALMLDGWSALVGSDRGRLIIAKVLAIAVLAAVGHAHRRFTMEPAALGRLTPLLRLAGVEVVLMAATIGLAVVLSMTG